MRHLRYITLLLATLLVGCAEPEHNDGQSGGQSAKYGYYYLDGEEIPVATAVVAEGSQLIVKLSPLDDILHATTYAAVGVHKDFLGAEMDVEFKFHNSDYIFAYEDPAYYHGPLRQLRSGTIYMSRNVIGTIDLRVDVVLYDGRTFRYENRALRATEATTE